MENFIATICFLAIGWLLRRSSYFPAATGNVLNLFVIHVSLPALVLLKIPGLTFSSRLLAPLITPWLMLALSACIVLVCARLFRWQRATTGCLLLLVPLGNTSFLGIPMVRAFFGDQAVPYALLYDQLGSFLALTTYGSFVLAVYGQGDERPTVGSVVKKICTFPPFLVLLLAFVLRSWSYPAVVISILQSLAATLVPVVMIAVGFQINLRLSRSVVVPLGVGLVIKQVIAPLLALLFIRLGGMEGEAARVAVFEAGMPPMVSGGALAILAGLAPELAAGLVGLGILTSFATLPLLFQLL